MIKDRGFVCSFLWKAYVLIFLLLCVISFPRQAIALFEIPLSEEWNLISLPEQQENITIEIITASIEGKFDSIWTYKNGLWYSYDPAHPGFSDLDTMDAGQAYWINMNVSGALVGAGLKASSSIELNSGWSFVGHNTTTATEMSEALDSTEGHVECVWGYENGEWKVYLPQNPGLSDLGEMKAGMGYWIKTDSSCTLSLNLDIPETTKAAPSNSTSVITSVTDDKITFEGNSTFLDSLSVGDILAAEPCAAAPQGFLRKITAISRNSNGAIVTTVPASLSEAIENGTVGITKQLTLNDIDLANSTFGPGAQLFSTTEIDWGIRIDQEIEDDNGNKITVTGEIVIEPDFLVNIEWESWELKEFRCVFTANEHTELSVQASSTPVDFDKIIQLDTPRIRMNPITVFVGWVPVVFVPEISFWVGADGHIVLEASASVRQEASLSAGVLYINSDWRPLKQFTNTFSVSSGASAEVSFKVKAGPQLDVFVYGLAGPYVNIMGFGQFLATASAAEVNWDWGIYVGAEFGCGVRTNNTLGIDASWDYDPIELARLRVYPTSEQGYANGDVTDALANALPGVTAEAIKNGDIILTATTDDNGTYSLALPPGADYEIKLSKTGYDSVTKYGISVNSGAITSVPSTTLQEESIGTGDFSGKITNALTGQGVSNVEIRFRKGVDNKIGGIYKTAQTGSDGSYLVSEADPGYYTGEMRASGYISGFFSALCLGGGQTNPNQNASITPAIDDSETRIVLTWSANPRDLDSHLTGPIEGSESRFHIYYRNKGSSTSSPYAQLDHDDVTSYGPETITIYRQFDGVYRYSVHHYFGSGSLTTTSSAHVAVYKGSTLWREFDVPSSGSGSVWTVFELNGNEIIEIGTIGSTITSVNKEDINMLENLPAKE